MTICPQLPKSLKFGITNASMSIPSVLISTWLSRTVPETHICSIDRLVSPWRAVHHKYKCRNHKIMDNRRYYMLSTRQLCSMRDETREPWRWLASVDHGNSKPLTVGSWRALTAICPIDLTGLGHYDNMSTITKIAYVQHHKCSHERSKRPNLNTASTNTCGDTHMLDRPTG